MVDSCCGSVTDAKDRQPAKAAVGMAVTPSGMENCFSDEQLLNAKEPILVRPAGT